jgi:hypothetical protein
LDQFLADLPELWRFGEARPTHRKGEPKPRHWKTRKDPFQDVWTDILIWLQEEPDSIAKVILERLEEKYRGQFSGKQLRTLQRRIGEWRQTMVRRLVIAGVPDRIEVRAIGAAAPPGAQAGLRLATLASARPAPREATHCATPQERDEFALPVLRDLGNNLG